MPSPPHLARAASLAAPPPRLPPPETLTPLVQRRPKPPSQVYANSKDAGNPYPVPNKDNPSYGMLYLQQHLVGFYYRTDIYFNWLGQPPCHSKTIPPPPPPLGRLTPFRVGA